MRIKKYFKNAQMATIAICILLLPKIVLADDRADYQAWHDYLKLNTIMEKSLRWLTYGFHSGLYKVCKVIESAFDSITEISFLDNSKFTSIYDKTKLIGIMLLTLGLIYLGYKYLIRGELDSRKIVANVVFSLCVIVGLTFFMQEAVVLVKGFNETFSSKSMDNSDKLFTMAFFDLKIPEADNFKKPPEAYDQKNTLNQDNISLIGINEEIKNDNIPILNNIYYLDQVQKLDRSIVVKAFDEYYLRWGYKPATSILSLIVMILVYFFSALKVVRIALEVITQKIMAPIYAGLDLENGQSLKGLIKEIFKNYATIMFIFIVLEVYSAYTAFITNMFSQTWYDAKTTVAYLIFMLSGAWFVMDGPKFFERTLGIDTGLTTEWKRAMSNAQIASHVFSSISKTLAGIVNAIQTRSNNSDSEINNSSTTSSDMENNYQKNEGDNESVIPERNDSEDSSQGSYNINTGYNNQNYGSDNSNWSSSEPKDPEQNSYQRNEGYDETVIPERKEFERSDPYSSDTKDRRTPQSDPYSEETIPYSYDTPYTNGTNAEKNNISDTSYNSSKYQSMDYKDTQNNLNDINKYSHERDRSDQQD